MPRILDVSMKRESWQTTKRGERADVSGIKRENLLKTQEPKISPDQALPGFYMDQAADHLKAIALLTEICSHYFSLDDAAGYYVACEKLIEHARELAKIQKELRLSFNVRNK